uniref:Uncharacterized protein n=1 Tax=Knipowitschia caucasica TaxID=637954 RepID=A0AAV2J7S8_KNICA
MSYTGEIKNGSQAVTGFFASRLAHPFVLLSNLMAVNNCETPKEESWKEQLKREIMEDVKVQMKSLAWEIVAELKPVVQPNTPTSATSRQRWYNERDDQGPELPPEVGDLSDRADLTAQQREQLRTLLAKWEKVFAQHEDDFGRTNLVQHKIPTGNSAPVRERYRLIPPLLYKEVKSLLVGMLEQGVIKESCSPWAAPIVLVCNKDGTWRFCMDYRKLNAVTHKDAFPLPRIEETLV